MQFLGAVSGEISRRYGQLHETDHAVLSDAEVWIPPEAWEEVSRLLRAASDLVHGAAQAPRSEDAVHVSVTAIGFEMAESATAADPGGTDDTNADENRTSGEESE